MNRIRKQSGEVSMFVIVFSMLLITIVVVSFTRIMIQAQQQSTATDLSQSALDSAQAGVEDAKRAILNLVSLCDSGSSECGPTLARFNPDTTNCNDSVKTLTDINAIATAKEVPVQTNGANSLDQAYTCVYVTMNTNEVREYIVANGSKVIPLRGVGAFDTIQIEWFTQSDAGGTNINLQSPSLNSPLLLQNRWSSNRPSIMRAQLVQFGDNGFRLTDFDGPQGGTSNVNTLFLYPSGTSGVASPVVDTRTFIGDDSRRVPVGDPTQINCTGNLLGSNYACTVRIQLPGPINAGSRTAFLRLTSLYRASNVRVSLLNSGTVVKFDKVQPSIDSTGRANSLFRRVNASVEMIDPNFPYPDAAINLSNNLCKDFRVTDRVGDYNNTCTP